MRSVHPGRAHTLSATALALALAASSALAQDSPAASLRYELLEGSTYQFGCFEPCACPITAEAPVAGTFVLTPTGQDGLFQTYDVTEVSWIVPAHEGLVVEGAGTYRRSGGIEPLHQLELDLSVGDEPVQHFDSGLVSGGDKFPIIGALISVNQMYCYDTVFRIQAGPALRPLPRHARFVLQPDQSSVDFSLFAGSAHSKLLGSVRLFLGDPDVPVIAIEGMVGLSVDGVDLIAPDFEPDSPALTEPLHLTADPNVPSIGAWNTLTGVIGFELHMIAQDTGLPVPQPVTLTGTLSGGVLMLEGNNGNVPDGSMSLTIKAFEVPLPPPPVDIWFSTESGFGAGTLSPEPGEIVPISDGDLLSRRGHVVRANHELTTHLGIMPIVPDLGLDAVMLGPHRDVWFSFEESIPKIWSETLGVWLKHGDLLSDAGFVVRTNEKLLDRFERMPVVRDVGLDAVARAPCRATYVSTEEGFFSEALGVFVGHGDLLSDRGHIVRTNRQLLQNFDIIDLTLGPLPPDYGLDALILRPHREIWFSTEIGFYVRDADSPAGKRWISDGDLLSSAGYVVARNLELVSEFGPVEDLDNFGLDALGAVVPALTADFDMDGDVDEADVDHVQGCLTGPDVVQTNFDCQDALMDADGDVDEADVALALACMSGENVPADPECGLGPEVAAWHSVRDHGGDAASILLDPQDDSPPVSEPRVGGIRRIVVDFDTPVAAVVGAVQVDNLTDGASIPADGAALLNGGRTLIISFNEGTLPDEKCYRIDLSANIPDLTGDPDCRIAALEGDVDNNLRVTLADAQLAFDDNGAGGVDVPRSDVDVSNGVSLADAQLAFDRNANATSCP